MTNKQIARILRETSSLIELTGGNEFRARAYQSAARTVEREEESVAELARQGALNTVAGIGNAMGAQISQLVERGSFDLMEELLSAIPPGLVEVLRVKGVGAKKARTAWKQLGITSLEELEEAASIGRLADLPGFGAKSQETMLDNIRLFKTYRTQRRFSEAQPIASPVLTALKGISGVVQAEFAGDFRRRMETLARVDIVLGATDVKSVVSQVVGLMTAQKLEAPGGEVVLSCSLADGLPVYIRVVPQAGFGSALWRATGSEEHCSAFELRFGLPADYPDERAVYSRAGLAWIPPELRENMGELEAAGENDLPELITRGDLKGVLHNHSTYSDGSYTLRVMADAARARGYSYFGICDHSRSLTIANGLSIERVQEQQDEIRRLNEEYDRDGGSPFCILSGIESDILADGSLDYPDDVLDTFDLVVASIHSRFNMTEKEATERLVRAIHNPHTSILGHATGRLLLSRAGYPIDHAEVIRACSESGTAIELNANPRRLDMDWRWIRTAVDQGVMISVNPDAHSIDELDYVEWGLAVARKGWLTPANCLTALPADQIKAWLRQRKSSGAAELR